MIDGTVRVEVDVLPVGAKIRATRRRLRPIPSLEEMDRQFVHCPAREHTRYMTSAEK